MLLCGWMYVLMAFPYNKTVKMISVILIYSQRVILNHDERNDRGHKTGKLLFMNLIYVYDNRK